ncbi:MAG: lipoyl(octanoyl) transferase LipB [Alphaproteobacteria bacterium]
MIEWLTSSGLVDYEEAVAFMEARVAAIATGCAGEMVWLLEHPPLYTAGTSAGAGELLAPGRFPVYRSGRGGRYTYHGPGQRVAYVMLDVGRRGGDVRRFVWSLEEWVIRALARLGVAGERREGRVGIWVVTGEGGRENKIAAIGVRLRRWISYHGIAVNVAPDLEHFSGIIPCGISGHGVTSLTAMGVAASMALVDEALRQSFEEVFSD